MNTTEPRIYVACLASYNNGVLHGEWIDDVTDADEVRERIAAMLRASRFPNVEVDCPECLGSKCDECGNSGKVSSAEEWAIHDYEGFAGVQIGENPDLDALAALAEHLEDDSYGEAFGAWVEDTGADWDDVSGFEDAFNGEWDSEQDFAENFAEDIGAIPTDAQWPCTCIDWEHATRELMYDYSSIDAPGGGVYIFRR